MKKLRKRVKLSEMDQSLMRSIIGGADVFAYGLAHELRKLKKRHPSWLTITKAAGKYNPVGQLPYFGAILTAEGRQILRAMGSR